MTVPQPGATPPPAPPRAPAQPTRMRPQFSMRTLLIVMAVVAVLAAVSQHRGIFSAAIALTVVVLWSVFPVTLGTLALYCRGHRQTFFLGAFAGSLVALYFSGMFPHMADNLGSLVAVFVGMCTASASSGFVALATRRFVERRGWNLPDGSRDPNSPH